MTAKPRALVRLVRRIKRDDAFDIDPAIRAGSLASLLGRRTVMALRGLVLALRSRSFVAPVFVGRGVVVTDAARLRLSPGVTIGDYCRLDCTGRLGITMGRGVTLRRGTHIEVTSVLRQVAEGCILGDRVGISEGCFIGAKALVRIGDDTIVGPHVLIVAENHVFADPGTPVRGQGVTREGIEIGRDCWIGGGAKILDGVHVGDGAVIGAGAVVAHDVEPLAVAVGVPARVVRRRGTDAAE